MTNRPSCVTHMQATEQSSSLVPWECFCVGGVINDSHPALISPELCQPRWHLSRSSFAAVHISWVDQSQVVRFSGVGAKDAPASWNIGRLHI